MPRLRPLTASSNFCFMLCFLLRVIMCKKIPKCHLCFLKCGRTTQLCSTRSMQPRLSCQYKSMAVVPASGNKTNKSISSTALLHIAKWTFAFPQSPPDAFGVPKPPGSSCCLPVRHTLHTRPLCFPTLSFCRSAEERGA